MGGFFGAASKRDVVLDVFFGLYAGINTFTQLVLKTCNRKGTWHRWPLRSGALPLI